MCKTVRIFFNYYYGQLVCMVQVKFILSVISSFFFMNLVVCSQDTSDYDRFPAAQIDLTKFVIDNYCEACNESVTSSLGHNSVRSSLTCSQDDWNFDDEQESFVSTLPGLHHDGLFYSYVKMADELGMKVINAVSYEHEEEYNWETDVFELPAKILDCFFKK